MRAQKEATFPWPSPPLKVQNYYKQGTKGKQLANNLVQISSRLKVNRDFQIIANTS